MMRHFTNLQTDLLRTFVTIVDLRNFTETGAVLGRTQPAISLQVKRLETIAGVKLMTHKGKHIELTPDGQTLLGYARDILKLNDRAVANLQRAKILGTLRVGLPIDYSIDFFQSIITKFSSANPDVQFDIRCYQSRDLLSSLQIDDLDMAIAITDTMPAPYVSMYWSERPIWACGPGHQLIPGAPVRLITHSDGCYYRKKMLAALSAEGRDWNISFESPGITALQKAVMANMGVTALTEKTLLPGMRVLGPNEGFPNLSNIHIGLFYKHVKMSDAALKLIEQITLGVTAFRSPIQGDRSKPWGLTDVGLG